MYLTLCTLRESHSLINHLKRNILLAAVDVNDHTLHGAAPDHAANVGDREERKQQDYDELVDFALEKAGSRKALVPSKSKKKMQQVDLSKFTRSKRQLVIEQALQVRCCTNACAPRTSWLQVRLRLSQAHAVLLHVNSTLSALLNSDACYAEQGCRSRKVLWQAQREDAEVHALACFHMSRLRRTSMHTCTKLCFKQGSLDSCVYNCTGMCRAEIDLASVEVRFQNLSIDADIAVGSRGEPTVLNAYRNKLEVNATLPQQSLTHMLFYSKQSVKCLLCTQHVAWMALVHMKACCLLALL